MRSTLTVVALGWLLPAAITAQDATLAGRVIDKASKGAIPDAAVRLAPTNTQLVTDATGYFRFDRVPPGTVSLFVRRLGFVPESVTFIVQTADDLDMLVELRQSVQTLDTVTVAERDIPLAERRLALAGFYERKRLGNGYFFAPAELEKQQQRSLAQIITATTPGSRLVRSLTGSMSWIATARRPGATLNPRESTIDEYDRQRGADPKACYPDVYLDGAVAYSFGRHNSLFDMNSLPTAHVSAVEFYVGPSEIPLQYNKTSAVCGVVLIWTK